jgi:hypothetical protein
MRQNAIAPRRAAVRVAVLGVAMGIAVVLSGSVRPVAEYGPPSDFPSVGLSNHHVIARPRGGNFHSDPRAILRDRHPRSRDRGGRIDPVTASKFNGPSVSTRTLRVPVCGTLASGAPRVLGVKIPASRSRLWPGDKIQVVKAALQ